MPKNKKGKYIAKKGKPSGPGHVKADIKEVDTNNLKVKEEIEEKYLKEGDEPSENIPQKHPNRNLDKPDVDKPAYS
jgi:hypothetical protein